MGKSCEWCGNWMSGKNLYCGRRCEIESVNNGGLSEKENNKVKFISCCGCTVIPIIIIIIWAMVSGGN